MIKIDHDVFSFLIDPLKLCHVIHVDDVDKDDCYRDVPRFSQLSQGHRRYQKEQHLWDQFRLEIRKDTGYI